MANEPRQDPQVKQAAHETAKAQEQEFRLQARIAELESKLATSVADAEARESERQRRADERAAAKADRRLDEAEREGGRYVVGGVIVDAHGQPVAD